MLLQQELVQDKRFQQAFEGVTIYGLAGANGSGKDTILETLAENGFFVFNGGDELRKITKAVMGTTRRGGNDSPTGKISNAQRSIYNGGLVTVSMIDYWSRILHMPQQWQTKGLATGSIRAVGEAKEIQKFGGKLIVASASPEIRYKRMTKRARSYEATISFEQFMAEEKAEMAVGETDPTKFGMAQVIDMADIVIENDDNDVTRFKQNIIKKLGLSNE